MGYVEVAMYFWGAVFLILWTLCAVVAVVGRLVFNRVFKRKRQKEHLALVNVITAAGLCLFLAYQVFALTLALFSGIMELDESDFWVLLVILSLLGIWSLSAFVWQMILVAEGRRRSTESNVLWAGIQLGIIIVVVIGLFAFEGSCVSETNGTSARCGLPMRPGVTVPTPTPGT
jgi:hypothetical protein